MIWRVLLIGSICTVSQEMFAAQATDGGSSGTIDACSIDLQIPRQGPPGRPGDSIGPVHTFLKIGVDGRVQSVELAGGTDQARRIVEAWMRESLFSVDCVGRIIPVVFTFKTEGPPSNSPFSWVSFRGPNHFVVHSQVRRPHVFRSPNPPKSK